MSTMHLLNARIVAPAPCRQAAPFAAALRPPTCGISGHPSNHRISRQQQRPVASGGESTSSSEAAPAADQRAGRATYRPNSYKELVNDAVVSILAATDDGLTRMEVEFPAVAGMDGYKGSSDLYIDANVQLAISAGRRLFEVAGKRVHILLPDETEFKRAEKLFASALELCDGVTLGHLTEGKPGALANPWLAGLFDGGMMRDTTGAVDPVASAAAADLFLAVCCSTVELADFEAYVVEQAGPERAVVSWNMELDTLRSDLGLLGFPPKDLQYRFLSYFKPVFYIRQRDYSKTVAVAPFIINYSGALFREYPGPWQVMLRQDSGVYACVAEDSGRRYGLGEFKAELTRAMGLEEAEGTPMAFLRTGYKTTTWWEEDADKERSSGWRT